MRVRSPEPLVLPGRTHPLVNMDGSGGYLLSGTTVERVSQPDSLVTTVETAEDRTETSHATDSEEKPGAKTSEDEADEPPAKRVKEES